MALAAGCRRLAGRVCYWARTSHWGELQLGALGGEAADRFWHWCGRRQGWVLFLEGVSGFLVAVCG